MDNGAKSMVRRIAIGAVVSLCTYLLLLALTAYGMTAGRIDETWEEGAAAVCACAASLAGGLLAGWTGKGRLRVIGGQATSFYALVAGGGILLLGEISLRRAGILLVAVLTGALVSSWAAAGRKKAARRKRHKAVKKRR